MPKQKTLNLVQTRKRDFSQPLAREVLHRLIASEKTLRGLGTDPGLTHDELEGLLAPAFPLMSTSTLRNRLRVLVDWGFLRRSGSHGYPIFRWAPSTLVSRKQENPEPLPLESRITALEDRLSSLEDFMQIKETF